MGEEPTSSSVTNSHFTVVQGNRRGLRVQYELLHWPMTGRSFVEAVASVYGLKIARARDERRAVLFAGVADV